MKESFSKNFQFDDGQSLIEVVVSIAIAAILGIALVTTTLITQRTSESAKNNTEATKLAQEGIEQIRVFRDRNGYSELEAIVNPNCFYIVTNVINGETLWGDESVRCPDGDDIRLDNTVFFRKMSMRDGIQSNTKIVTVDINWEDSKGKQNVKSETILSRWETF